MRWQGWLLLAGSLPACRDDAAAPIHIVAGPQPSDSVTLVPRSALAEYIEVSADESALLVTLTSVERACGDPPRPAEDAVSLMLRVALPGGARLKPGGYPILADARDAERPHARITVKLRGHRKELLPGGELELRSVDLNPRGSVSGLLKLEFPGDAEHPATRVSGRFSAHFCRVSRLK